MPDTKSALKCMNCGTPIQSGFFCAKCQAGDGPAQGEDGWKGSRFTGDAGRQRRRKLLMEDLARYGKMLLILAIVGGVAFGGYAMFGDRIRAALGQAESVTKPREKYDPTKDGEATEDGKGEQNGSRAFTDRQRHSVDAGPD